MSMKETDRRWLPAERDALASVGGNRVKAAELLGISQSYISRLEKKIIKRLKLELEKL